MVEIKFAEEIKVRIPMNMVREDLTVDPGVVGTNMDKEIDDLNDHYSWADEEEMYHVFLGTVVLHEATRAPLAECLATAKIWWRG